MSCSRRRIKRVASTQCLATPLTGAVARRQRIETIRIGLNRTVVLISKSVAHRVGANLIKLHVFASRDLRRANTGNAKFNSHQLSLSIP